MRKTVFLTSLRFILSHFFYVYSLYVHKYSSIDISPKSRRDSLSGCRRIARPEDKSTMPRRKQLTDSGASPCEKMICPSPEELSVISNNVRCEQCSLVFANASRYRLHDLKVHQRKKLDKIAKENVRYHCPVQSCVYAVNSQRYFSTMKYLKQVRTVYV